MTDTKEWAERVIEEVSIYAERLDLAWYPLQSPSIKNPKVLFLGLNPGDDSSYTSQKNNDLWEFIAQRQMAPERLLKGNPYFELEKDEWPIVRGLKSIPYFNNLLNDGDYVFMNYFYLNTKSFKEVDKSHDLSSVKTISKELTYQYIDLVKPEMIIVLGTSNGIDELDKTFFSDRQVMLQGISQRLLVKASYKGTPVLAIPHPSWLMLQPIEREAINQNIYEASIGLSLSLFDIPKTRPITRFDISCLEIEMNNGKKLLFHRVKKDTYNCEIEGCGPDLLTIQLGFHNAECCWSIRSATKFNGSWINNLKYRDTYINSVDNVTNYNEEGWLFRKHFASYGAKSQSELKELVLMDIQSLINDIAKCIPY